MYYSDRRGSGILARMKRASRISWWLWPNVLNLDAPVVALVWQELFAGLAGVPLSFGERALLFLSVWEVYFADRWLDSQKTPTSQLAARHVFHQRHRKALLAIGALNFPIILGLAWNYLSASGWIGAGVVSLLTAIYFGRTHFKISSGRFVPKEAAVGVIFAGGTFVVPWMRAGSYHAGAVLWIPGIVFACLCALNCCFVTVWENLPRDQADANSLLNRFRILADRLGILDLSLGFIATGLMVASREPAERFFYAAILATTVAFLWLHRKRHCRREEAMRVLADAAMLTPLIALALWKGIA